MDCSMFTEVYISTPSPLEGAELLTFKILVL